MFSAFTQIYNRFFNQIYNRFFNSATLASAAGDGDVDTVLSVLNKLDDKQLLEAINKRSEFDTALINAIRGGHSAVVQAILDKLNDEQLLEALNAKLFSGFTAFTVAAGIGHIEVVRVIIDKLNDAQPVVDVITTPNGRTAFMNAVIQGNAEVVKIILNRIDEGQALEFINMKDDAGDTSLIKAASTGNEAMVEALLGKINNDQLQQAISVENNRGKSAIVVAFESGHTDMVSLLQLNGAVLPLNLRRRGDDINDNQSTHTATVHDSLARSAIALASRYLNISDANKAILKAWASGMPAASDENQKRDAMLAVMQSASTQSSLTALTNEHNPGVLHWVNSLNQDEDKNSAAKRAVERIYRITDFNESRTNLTLSQVLSLVWVGLNDAGIYEESKAEFPEDKLKERLAHLVQNLYESQREYNLNDKGIETDITSDDKPACVGGTFNKMVHTLSGGLHPDVATIMVNKKSIKAKANILLAQEFDASSFSPNELSELYDNFIGENMYYVLSDSVKSKLKDKILIAINDEFYEFEQSRLIPVGTIEIVVNSALSEINAHAVGVISKKLQSYKDSQISTQNSDMHPQDNNLSVITRLRRSQRILAGATASQKPIASSRPAKKRRVN